MRVKSKVCVVGAGRWGKNHVRSLYDMGALGGVVETDPRRVVELKEQYPGIPVYADLSEALDLFSGFTVATPAGTHFEIARSILQKKRHVLVEKPLALTTGEAEELEKLAGEQGVNLMVGHVLLFHPAIQKIKQLIQEGKIGRLQYLYSNRLNLGAVRTEENALWSFAPHDISIFHDLIGERPVSVSASGGMFLQPHIHDSTITVLQYPRNIVGHIFVSWLHPFKEHRLVIIGSKGMFSFEDSSEAKEILFYEKGIDWLKGEPIPRNGPTEVIAYEKALPLTRELEYFVEHLDGRPVEISTGRIGVEVLKVLERATVQLQKPLAPAVQNKAAMSGKPVFVHSTASVDEGAEIGEGTSLWHYSHVMKGARIGRDCKFGQNTHVAGGAVIGNQVKVQNNVSIYSGVVIEDDVFLGPSCVFTNVLNPRAEINRRNQYQMTLLRKGVTVGANATIVCGTEIGRYAFIAAGAVVTRDVPDYALMIGVPARQAGWMSRHGHRLPDPDRSGMMVCPESGLRYCVSETGELKCLDVKEEVALPV